MIEITTTENTAYFVATLINRILSENGIDRQIPTQMMYNYTRNGLVAKGKKGSASTIRYTDTEVVLFVNKWFKKNYNLSDVVSTKSALVDPFATFSGSAPKVSLVRSN